MGLATTFGKGTVGQLVATSFLSLLWFALQVKTSPYRFSEDNSLKVVCELVMGWAARTHTPV